MSSLGEYLTWAEKGITHHHTNVTHYDHSKANCHLRKPLFAKKLFLNNAHRAEIHGRCSYDVNLEVIVS